MRKRALALCVLAATAGLGGCARPAADWSYTPFDNFDPSQVPMLPTNRLRTTTPAVVGAAMPEPSPVIAANR